MKTLLLLLATLTVALSPAYTLRCHVCSDSNNCKKVQQCPSGYHYCKTVISVESLAGNLVEKSCEVSCTTSDSQQGQVSSSTGTRRTQCCREDLCNERLFSAAPAATLLSSATSRLLLALGLLALLLGPRL
ncbi:lymphocyte antigen 6D [Octodon degus]|uniref:Lymphocyte antigen 6D n=1 Tax=Octodon degus TaxID=10160 RepID=A0A6P3FG66_OCTDE|nr:lymphocyte antigen 6D [Octodon degus]